jgi:hypothetical protein
MDTPFKPDLWTRLARLDVEWDIMIKATFRSTGAAGVGRFWQVTLRRRSEPEGPQVSFECDTLAEAMESAATAAEAFDLSSSRHSHPRDAPPIAG